MARFVDRRTFLRRSAVAGLGILGAPLLGPSRASSAGNPSIMSHVNAGIIAAGGMTDYGSATPKAVGGLRLWVRAVPGESMTGERIPPAPSHLIRRALKQGHL